MCPIFALLLLAVPAGTAQRDQLLRVLATRIAQSGRILSIAEEAQTRTDPKPAIAPGAAPLLTFRYFEGNTRQRFGKLDLVMDDAGH